jgi:hypothetical protein
LRKAIADSSGLLQGAPVEEFAGHLVVGGYLQEEPPLTLMADVLEILEAGGLGLRSPELQPCSLEVFWDADAARISGNVDLSMSIDWIGAPTLTEHRRVFAGSRSGWRWRLLREHPKMTSYEVAVERGPEVRREAG